MIETKLLNPEEYGQAKVLQSTSYSDCSVKKVLNGFVINYGFNSAKVATSFDDMVTIIRDVLSVGGN